MAMSASTGPSAVAPQASKIERKLLNFFPVPKYLEMPTVGLRVSEHAVRFIELVRTRHGLRVGRYAERPVKSEKVNPQDVQHNEELKSILRSIKKEFDLSFITATLPEEKSYLFKTEIPVVDESEIASSVEFLIEENVPISLPEAVFDYEIIQSGNAHPEHIDVSVTVVPLQIVNNYTELFQSVGLTPLSFSLESKAIARGVVREGDTNSYMIVNISTSKTSISIVDSGVVQFSSNVNFGGEAFSSAIKKHYYVDGPGAHAIKVEKGFKQGSETMELLGVLMNTISVLKDEISRLLVYWESFKNKSAEPTKKISGIILCGRDAGIIGLDEYLALSLKMKVERANVWVNAFSLDDYIPSIEANMSLSFAAPIGLALDKLHYA
ncbi:MAG: pilus assembly protein PilM [bacterium]|nr:pilus assembly protein PilM [bacterium]